MAISAVRFSAAHQWAKAAFKAAALPAAVLAMALPAIADGPAYYKSRSAKAEPARERCASGPFAGYYAGLAAGLGFADSSNSQDAGDNYNGDNNNTFTWGGYAGRNWQCGSFVYGIEGDVNFGGAKTTVSYPGGVALSSSPDWYSTIRGRVGIAEDNFMIYATGGLALGTLTHSITALALQDSSSSVGFGYTVGGGMEMALGRWAVRAEGLYVDLGNTSFSYPVPNFSNTSWSDSFWVARLGVSYKLGGSD